MTTIDIRKQYESHLEEGDNTPLSGDEKLAIDCFIDYAATDDAPYIKQKLTIIKIGWLASTWSSITTLGLVILSFSANYHLAGNNGWCSFLIFLLALVVILSKALDKNKHIHKFKTVQDAVNFLIDADNGSN